LAGVPFADMLVASLIICYSFFLFQESRKNRLKYGLIFFTLLGALAATQTRGAMVSFLLSYAFVSFVAFGRSKIVDSARVRARVRRLTAALIIIVLLAFVILGPFASSLSHKFYTLYQIPEAGAQETIQLRLFIWGTALKAFAAHPLLGIGVGQFTVVHLVIPELHFSPLFQHVAGLGAHNLVLAYLSQTGSLGLCALLYFMFSFLRVGWSTRKSSVTGEDLCVSVALLGILFFVAASSLYAGAWFYSLNGMEFMFFLALTVVLNRSLIRRRKDENALAITR
jgi:O-antigen ligase